MLSHKQNTVSPSCKSTREQKAVASECFLPPCRSPLKSGEVKEGRGGEGRAGEGGVLLVVLALWKVCVAINSSPATCILASFSEIQSFWSWWIYWGFIMQLLRSLLSGLLKRMNQTVGDVRCWVSRGLGMGLVYSLV